jgi:hypothetical protein
MGVYVHDVVFFVAAGHAGSGSGVGDPSLYYHVAFQEDAGQVALGSDEPIGSFAEP